MNLTSAWVSVTKLSTAKFLFDVFPCLLFKFFQVRKVDIIVFQNALQLKHLFFFQLFFVPHKIDKVGNSTQILLAKADQLIVDIVFGYGGFVHFFLPPLQLLRRSQALKIVFQDKGIQDLLDGSFVFFAEHINFLKFSQ